MHKGMNAAELQKLIGEVRENEQRKALLIVMNASDKEEAVKLLEQRLKA